jgi:hypothetical protein
LNAVGSRKLHGPASYVPIIDLKRLREGTVDEQVVVSKEIRR